MAPQPDVSEEAPQDLAHLAVLSGLPLKVYRLEASAGELVAGRLPEAPLRFDHFEVSRRHCRFFYYAARDMWAVEDLGSQWGTKVNGQKIEGAQGLQRGDRIELGPVTVLFGIGEPPSEAVFEKLRSGAGPEAGEGVVGQVPSRIPLGDQVTLGRDRESSVVLSDPAVSRRHAVIARTPTGFRVTDLKSSSGSFVNGHRFDEHNLTIGDRLQLGPYLFQFDGESLKRLAASAGGRVEAREVFRRAKALTILNGISLRVEPSQFAGIIGPSGAGKSSLLDVLSGLRRPDSGKVTVDGEDVYSSGAAPACGYVPQQDIVHPELTVKAALQFGAELRLERGTSSQEMDKLLVQTMTRLGLEERAHTRIGHLSGGQRKRVSVGVELLARPPVLFLDEPTSGLDPATEFKLMELLRDLADTGCTIVCTTHVVENIYLMDQLLVVRSGQLLFSGTPQEAREHFKVETFSNLYEILEDLPPDSVAPQELPPSTSEEPQREKTRVQRANAFAVLMRRQWAILCADWSNFAILLGQPVLVAALVSWVSNDSSLAMFFAYIAALWFGCSNASQDIVRELPIYRRERVIGLGRVSYVAAKLIFLGLTTGLQAMLLYGVLQLGELGLGGSVSWQVAALAGMAAASVGIGLAVSALARSLLQAVLIVPLLLIPLILFSGYTVNAYEMKPGVAVVARLLPTFAAQRAVDVSFLWRQRIARNTLADHWTSFRNVNRDTPLKLGETYARPMPGVWALVNLAAWSVGASALALVTLARRERE